MINVNIKRFIADYLICLKERTTKVKSGIDWVIYGLGIAKNWTPIRLPFFRSSEASEFKFKTEAEFGIDLAFINKNGKELIIFVLKDEELNNRNWTKNNFDEDIRKASLVSINYDSFDIKNIRIILCYNRDEDANGIKLYDNLVKQLLLNNSKIIYEKWNLTKLVDEVVEHLLTSDLLPQDLSGILSYICAQFQDLKFGSNPWNNQLVPQWKTFIDRIITENPSEKNLRLIPIVLLIIKSTSKVDMGGTPSWIDIVEWVMIKIWSMYPKLTKNLKKIIWSIWINFYIIELETFLNSNKEIYLTEHGINSKKSVSGYLIPISDSYIAFWYIGRIGIYSLATQDLLMKTKYKDNKERIDNLLMLIHNWIKTCIEVNPAVLRPLIDLNHIELFLMWMALYQGNDKNKIFEWLLEMEKRLIARRSPNFQMPFIEGRNNFELVAEYAATQKKPQGYVDDASYLLLMILELSFILPDEERDKVINNYYKHLILGLGDDESKISDDSEIDLQSWQPSKEWSKMVFEKEINDGTSISTGNFKNLDDTNLTLTERIKKFIDKSTQEFSNNINWEIPQAAYILACIKNKSPLPPIFWRNVIFPDLYKEQKQANESKKSKSKKRRR